VKPQPLAPVPRVALTREEAAASIGVSLAHFERHVQPHLRVIRSGSARLIPLRELDGWADRAATLAGSPTMDRTKERPRTVRAAGGMAQRK
jgi:hypothetical protein